MTWARRSSWQTGWCCSAAAACSMMCRSTSTGLLGHDQQRPPGTASVYGSAGEKLFRKGCVTCRGWRMTRQRRSLQDLIHSRQQSSFVGRQGQLVQYQENLSLPVDDERRRFLFNIHGD